MTTITLPRATVEQALEALKYLRDTAICSADTDTANEVIPALEDALAQQAAPVRAPLKRGITGRCTRKVCECEKEGLGPECIYLEPVVDGYPLWSGIPEAEPVEPWSTRERFYEAVDRAVEAVRQEMKIKTVTMSLPEYDITLPIIDAYSGHVVVGPVVPAPPQRKVKGEEK